MIGTIARIAMLRVLPRKLLPIVTAWQVLRMVRGRRAKSTDPEETRARRDARRVNR